MATPAHNFDQLPSEPAPSAYAVPVPVPVSVSAPEPQAESGADHHVRSLAMPGFDHEPGPALAVVPELGSVPSPDAVDDVAHDVSGTLRSPSVGLLVGMVALAWQLITWYAGERLPARLETGQPLDRFDEIVNGLPLAGTTLGMVVGMLLALGALALVVVSHRSGVRERVLLGAGVAIACLAFAVPTLVSMLA